MNTSATTWTRTTTSGLWHVTFTHADAGHYACGQRHGKSAATTTTTPDRTCTGCAAVADRFPTMVGL